MTEGDPRPFVWPQTIIYMTTDSTAVQLENRRLREQNAYLRQSIERLQAQIAAMQAERWTPTITSEPGCDDEVSWSHSQVHNP